MTDKPGGFAWNLFTELRKELVSLQTIRSQVIGFKITFVTTSIALIAANLGTVTPVLFIIPGFAAIFFDLLIHSYSFSIKRTGFYCRNHLEPILREEFSFPKARPLWEEFMASKEAGKNVSFWGNLGITVLAVAPAIFALFDPFVWSISLPLLIALALLLIYDIRTLYRPVAFAVSQARQPTFVNPKPCVAVIVEANKQILLARRGIEPAKGKWDILGGFIERGESAGHAATREVLEETGLHVRITKYLGSIPDVYGETGIPTLNFCYVAEVISGEQKAQSDVASLSSLSLDSLPLPNEMAFPHQKEALLRYRKSLEMPSDVINPDSLDLLES